MSSECNNSTRMLLSRWIKDSGAGRLTQARHLAVRQPESGLVTGHVSLISKDSVGDFKDPGNKTTK